MRIDNTKLRSLETSVKKMSLKVEDFVVIKSDDILDFKYKDEYFYFQIYRLSGDLYRIVKTTIINPDPETEELDWRSTQAKFQQWVAQISTDEKNKSSFRVTTTTQFPDLVIGFSRMFIKIYEQAQIAENMGLDEICGLGYRKSYEFLIKDYLKAANDESEHRSIEKLRLYECIRKYINDARIGDLAYRVLWLGNDHAHYVKRWHDKDLSDLKRLIDLSIEWIIAHERLKVIDSKISEVEQEMPGEAKRNTTT